MESFNIKTMSEENIKKMKEMSRDDLENLIISLWDDLYEKDNDLNKLIQIKEKKDGKKDRFIKHLESENERLTKAVSGMYQDIKLKTLRFFIDAKPTDEQRDIFANLFKNYLK